MTRYRRSFGHLEAFAKDQDDPDLEVRRNDRRRVVKGSRSGVWHETLLVRAGEFEAEYSDVPPHGAAMASSLVPVADSVGARQRLEAHRSCTRGNCPVLAR